MGLFSNLLATAKAFDSTLPITPLDKIVVREIQERIDQGDVTVPVSLQAANEVQQIELYEEDFTSGDFTLSIRLSNAAEFTTLGIAFDAVAAAVQSAIDTAANTAGLVGSIGWTNGDIMVMDGPLTSGGSPLVLAYTGSSVSNKAHMQAVINLNTLVGGLLASPSETRVASGNAGVPVTEVQEIAQFATPMTGGEYKLTLDIVGAEGGPFDTSGLSRLTTASGLQNNINFRAGNEDLDDEIGWQDDDIVVTGGPLNDAPFVLTFSGNSVKNQNQGQTVLDIDTLSGGTLASPAESTTTPGNPIGPIDEVQTLAQYDTNFTSGNMEVVFDLGNTAQAFKAVTVAYNSTASQLEARIDTGAVSSGLATLIGWSPGDIVVTGGPLTVADFTLTYSGDSVKLVNHGLAVVNEVTMAGGSLDNPPVLTVSNGEAAGGAADEVQCIAPYAENFSSGEFTLTIKLSNASEFTTVGIAFDATAATIETAIDVAATAASLGIGWTNGDISVSNGPLTSAGILLTYDGDSVDDLSHNQAVINVNTLSGGDLASPAEVTLSGGSENDRDAWAALIAMGIAVESDVPSLGDDTVPFMAASNLGNNSSYPSETTIRALAAEAAIADGNDTAETEVLAATRLTK